jgi:hypothetical protein
LARRIAAAVVLALLLTGFVVLRDAHRASARSTIVSGPSGNVGAIPLPRTPVAFAIAATRAHGRGHVLLQVGTYLQPARDTVTLTVLGSAGARLARCVFPPGSYHDNQQLACAVRDVGAVRGLRVLRQGNRKLAVSASGDTAGYLAVDEQASLWGRTSTVLGRIAVPLPAGAGATVAVAGLFGSLVLAGLGVALALRREDEG